jgi:AcrR family transcriptional regulator
MARPSLRPEEVERFRQRLCEAALLRIAERGYAGVTLRGLARDLGCSYATPYRYFRDKEAIFAAVRALAYERFGNALEAAARELHDPEQRLRAMVKGYLDFAAAEPEAYRIMMELELPGPDHHPEYWAKERQTLEVWEAELVRAVEAGVLAGDPATIAHVFWAGVHGAVSLHLGGKLILGRPIEALGSAVTDALLAAYRPTANLPSEKGS